MLSALAACAPDEKNTSATRIVQISPPDSSYNKFSTIRMDSFFQDKLYIKYQPDNVQNSGTASDNYWRTTKMILLQE